jgi:hypothetical protein
MVVYVYNPSTPEAEVGGLKVQCQFQLHSKLGPAWDTQQQLSSTHKLTAGLRGSPGSCGG